LKAPTAKEFWRTEQITEQQFLNTADTFDLLLCRCNNGGAKLTRMYTGSDFDHVAMLLRFDMPGNGNQNDIFLIEATGSGVKVKRWSNLRPHIGKFYDRVMLRHLDFDRDDKTLDALEKFLQ